MSCGSFVACFLNDLLCCIEWFAHEMTVSCLMVLLVSQAEPAKVITTSWALHMHTSTVLLDWHLAFRAILGVSLHPGLIISRLRFHLVLPHGIRLTVQRIVRIFWALDAEDNTANTGYLLAQGVLYPEEVLTVLTRTPVETALQVHKRVMKESNILLVELIW